MTERNYLAEKFSVGVHRKPVKQQENVGVSRKAQRQEEIGKNGRVRGKILD
jgi:hypothetical protein